MGKKGILFLSKIRMISSLALYRQVYLVSYQLIKSYSIYFLPSSPFLFFKAFEYMFCYQFLYFDLLPSHPPLLLGQVQPFRPGVGEWCEAVLCWGQGVGQIKNIFSLIVQSMCHFLHRLHNGCRPHDYVFLRKNTRIFRRVVGQE